MVGIRIPRVKMPDIRGTPARLGAKLREYRRVLKITKKPSSEEFKVIVKVTAAGIAIIGLIGFAISMAAQLLKGL